MKILSLITHPHVIPMASEFCCNSIKAFDHFNGFLLNKSIFFKSNLYIYKKNIIVYVYYCPQTFE